MGITPTPNARGYFHWSEIRGSNALMDNLASVYAWTGRNTWRSEGGSNNPQTRFYLGRRYTRSGWWPIAEAYKQVIQGAPRGDEAVNYRAYIRWADVTVRGTTAARAGVALMLGCKDIAQASPYYQNDLTDFARNYLHQYIEGRYADLVALVQRAKQAAANNAYGDDARRRHLDELRGLDDQLRRAHHTLARLTATRKDMSLDEAILEATATQGANKNLTAAIREHQSGVFADANCVVDSIEYHQQVKKPQIEAFLKYVRAEIAKPTDKPIPGWQEFFLHGTSEFIRDAKPVPYADKAEKAKPSEILEAFLKLVE
jgi:hypothetical protein